MSDSRQIVCTYVFVVYFSCPKLKKVGELLRQRSVNHVLSLVVDSRECFQTHLQNLLGDLNEVYPNNAFGRGLNTYTSHANLMLWLGMFDSYDASVTKYFFFLICRQIFT